MNSVNSKIVNHCSKYLKISLVLFLALQVGGAQAWEIDLSRRQLDFQKVEDQDRMPASTPTPVKESKNILSEVFDSSEPAQEIVITNTENGFVPSTLRLRKGGNYKIHVVNINAKEKNVSFILDAFSESHNTVFGNMKSFSISPKQTGTFSYLCPETAVQGKIVIYSDERKPASE